MHELLKLSLDRIIQLLHAKEISSLELTKIYIKQIEKQKSANAFITECFDNVLSKAKEADQNISNKSIRPLEGVPLGIKDIFCTKGIRTSAGSKILDNFIPPHESTVTQNLLDAGAIFLGKTNCDEFAMGSANITSAFGPVTNPWKSSINDLKLVPGGSSGGSAAAVSNYSTVAALGTDTGGSIRQPASFCGIVGVKPTYGLCSRYGMVAFASSLDQAGPMTRDVKDSAIMLQHIASHDLKDSTSIKTPIPQYKDYLNDSIRGKKIGIPLEFFNEKCSPDIMEMWNESISWLTEQGAQVEKVSLPNIKYSLMAYYILAPAEASSNLARYDGVRYGKRVNEDDLHEMYYKSRGNGFGYEVKKRIMIGTYVLSSGYYDAYYLKAQKVRTLIQRDFQNCFKKVDALLFPTTPNTAFPIENSNMSSVDMYMNDILTVPINIAGLPAISIPCKLSKKDHLPLSMQIAGPALSEKLILNIAQKVEDCAEFEKYRKKGLQHVI